MLFDDLLEKLQGAFKISHEIRPRNVRRTFEWKKIVTILIVFALGKGSHKRFTPYHVEHGPRKLVVQTRNW